MTQPRTKVDVGSIIYSLEDGVAELAMTRDHRLNALTPSMILKLSGAIDRAAAEGARAILLRGEGRAFCSGADLAGEGDDAIPTDAGGLLKKYYNPLILKIMSSPIPMVTAVHGAAAGGGCSLALSGDFVVAARSAYFLFAFINIGLVPDSGASWLAVQCAGRARALEMLLLGERIPADKADAWGMIHKVVNDDELLIESRSLAKRIAAGPTQAIALTRRAILHAASHSLEQSLRLEAESQRTAGATSDFVEGVSAFVAKRRPNFTGS